MKDEIEAIIERDLDKLRMSKVDVEPECRGMIDEDINDTKLLLFKISKMDDKSLECALIDGLILWHNRDEERKQIMRQAEDD